MSMWSDPVESAYLVVLGRQRLAEECEAMLKAGSSAEQRSLWEVLQDLVPDQPPGLTAMEFHERWPSTPAPGLTTLLGLIGKHWKDAGWQQDGSGVKNDPRRWWKPKKSG